MTENSKRSTPERLEGPKSLASRNRPQGWLDLHDGIWRSSPSGASVEAQGLKSSQRNNKGMHKYHSDSLSLSPPLALDPLPSPIEFNHMREGDAKLQLEVPFGHICIFGL